MGALVQAEQDSTPTERRGPLRKLRLLAFSLLVTGLLLEVGIRVLGLAYDPQFDRRGKSILVDSADPEIRKELPAHFDGLMLGAQVQTNSFGLRGPEIPVEKPRGVYRIAVLGDSWAFGWGVGQEKAFPAVLERLLQQAAGPDAPRYEVLNFSVPAYDTLQQLAVLRRRVLRFEPDLVLIAFNINDVELHDSHGPKQQERLYRDIERFLNTHSHLIRFVNDRLRRVALRMSIERSGKVNHYMALYAADSSAWQQVQDALGEMQQLARQAGACTYLAVCPWMNVLNANNPYRDIHRQIVETSISLGTPALDLFPYFEGRDPNDLRISPLDGHPRDEGHRIAAEAIAADLQARGLLVCETAEAETP